MGMVLLFNSLTLINMEYKFLMAAIKKWNNRAEKRGEGNIITPYALLRILAMAEQLEGEEQEKLEVDQQKAFDKELGDN